MSHRTCFSLLLVLSASALSAQDSATGVSPGWEIMNIDTLPESTEYDFGFRTIQFRNGHRTTVVLNHLEVLGQLPRSARGPIILLAGIECGACDAETRIYVAPADTDFVDPRRRPFSFPGAHRTAEEADTAPFYRGRLFLGHCGTPDYGAIWLQAERDSTGHWIQSAFYLRVEADLVASGFSAFTPVAAGVREALRRKTCREVPGRTQYIF